MISLNRIPVTATFRGAGNNAYELVEKKDKEGKVYNERTLIHNTQPASITRNLNYLSLLNDVPYGFNKYATIKGKFNNKKWKAYLKKHQQQVIDANIEDAFWDLPEVSGKCQVVFSYEEPVFQ